MNATLNNTPHKQGLYNPENEHDSCGVGFIVKIDGDKSHQIIEDGLKVLENMSHRGAEGADNKSGDGAGIMTQIPHEFILLSGIPVPAKGKYGTGLLFLSKDKSKAAEVIEIIEKAVREENLTLMPLRKVPVNSEILGSDALKSEPDIFQIFVTSEKAQGLEQKLFILRKKIEHRINELNDENFPGYIVSLSSQKIVYKGMLTSEQLKDYFLDLSNPYYTSAIALVHSRFSTNTFPRWDLAQPFRILGHNGEINTIVGNRIWATTTLPIIAKQQFADRYDELNPILQKAASDSASLDNILEFLIMSGMDIERAIAMLLPESYNDKNPISRELKAFYDYHSIFMEPWDGPATLLFSDGVRIGGVLDRNGLRPARYVITKDGKMVVASEVGALEIAPEDIESKGRFKPGKIMMVDTAKGEILDDSTIKKILSAQHDYRNWMEKNRVELSGLRSGRKVPHKVDNYEKMLKVFGYSFEDISRVITPMVTNSNEAIGSMGDDATLPLLSKNPQRLFNYFRQRFAQVTNPPIDPLREELMMSLKSHIGASSSDLITPREEHCKVVKLDTPIITNREIDILEHIEYKGFFTKRLSILFDANGGVDGLQKRLDELYTEVDSAIAEGCNYIIISDKGVDENHAPIPSLLALTSIHRRLIENGKRNQTALIVESAEPREAMHIALLMGFGASAICPYMAFGIIDDLVENNKVQLDYDTAEKHYITAINKALKKIMSKLGISTIRSYRGAQLFDALGLDDDFTEKYFKGINSPIGGVGLSKITEDTLKAFRDGFANEVDTLPNNGYFNYKRGGENHAWTPANVKALNEAVRENDYTKFKNFTAQVDNTQSPTLIRHLMKIGSKGAIDIAKVESEEKIIKRFVAGAISFGAISIEAHELLAQAMNELGAASNTGEGGEDPSRFEVAKNKPNKRSSVKQIASGRFGVSAHYLVNADEIQIKAAQGAKPGEGGQLPGYKVTEMVAKTRNSLPGITLISPPPHHDIYSIEDLAQLIFDIRSVNPDAIISVKLVASSGVGTVAAGVVKAKADKIIISGACGGTGASPISSIRYAGMPLEFGVSEVQQTLMLNSLRGKVIMQADGQLKSGADVIKMALLGAEEFAFGTAAMISMGCIMDRRCHTNKCPVGIATQDPIYRAKFAAKVEHIKNYFTMLAREVREYLADMGCESLDEIIGANEMLSKADFSSDDYLNSIDISKLLYSPKVDTPRKFASFSSKNAITDSKDEELLKQLTMAIENQIPTTIKSHVHNTNRSVATMISGIIAKKYGKDGLPNNTINIELKGAAGQSFGAFLTSGVTLRLEGEANDYLAKGLSGGKISVFPPKTDGYKAENNNIAGNTLMYGAISGEVYINGRVGERFAVRNSGALGVVEGVGDHCAEYMTGGRLVVLGSVGRNFGAGMSGGIAYVWNPKGDFDFYCNMELVEINILNDEDKNEVFSYIKNHVKETDSQLAKRLIDNWEQHSKEFIKVLPIEYKKILDSQTSVI